jgi:hypothetical protein
MGMSLTQYFPYRSNLSNEADRRLIRWMVEPGALLPDLAGSVMFCGERSGSGGDLLFVIQGFAAPGI